MPILLLDRPIDLPIATMRKALVARVPAFAWCVGEDDNGGAYETGTFIRPQTVLGRAREEMVMTVLTLRHYPFDGDGVPAHRLHLDISRPSIESDEVARRIVLAIASTLASEGAQNARLQLAPGGEWLDAPAVTALLADLDETARPRPRREDNAATLAYAARLFPDVDLGAPAAAPPPPAPTPAKPRLASFSFILDGDIFIDWPLIKEAMNTIDPEGGWEPVAVPGGLGFVMGRTTIRCLWAPIPIERAVLDSAYSRSFWFDGDTARVARGRQYLTVEADQPETFAARIATAKAMTIMIGLIARCPPVSAVCNHEVATIFSPAMVEKLVGVLHTDEIPIQLWTWTAPNAMVDGDVSLTTGGLEPFVGYEVEVWNAPHPVSFVGERMSGALRYLLINGPVINHGDTIGDTVGDRSVRCFFGPSRADRARPVTAMFLEFDTGAVTAPRKDLPTPRPDPALSPRAAGWPPVRRAGGFGRKGL